MEYTLQDTHDALKELEGERQHELEQLADRIANNRIVSLNPSAVSNEVWPKKLKFVEYMLEHLTAKELTAYPLPDTVDLRVEVLKDLKAEVKQMEELEKAMEDKLSNIQEDIAYLRKKKEGLQKMEKACFEMSNTTQSENYADEQIIAKRIFHDAKKDLRDVVNILFPDDDQMHDLLADLSSAFTKGGDDMYVDVTTEMESCIACLLEYDVVQYHRNDNTKIKFTEML